MKVTQEKLPASQVGLEIEITSEMATKVYEKTVQEFIRNINIPGFRKGKVPRQVLIQRVGASRIKAAALEELIEEGIKQAIEQEKIDALGNVQLKSSFDELVSTFAPGSTLTFSAAVDVPPQATLQQYQGLTVQAEEVKPDPARVDEVLEGYRTRSATIVPIESRPAQEKDIAVVDFSGQLAPEGDEPAQTIPGGSAEDFEIELSEGRFIPGFIEGIIGMNAGETREVSATFPTDYPQEDLAGKEAIFTITVKELKERELPALDDDFAQEVSEFDTLEEFRQSLETKFQKEADERTRANKETALLAELVKHVEVDLPETLIKRESDHMLTQTAMQLSQQGMDIKQLFTPELVARLREQARPEAIVRIQRTLALKKIAELESITVEESAIAAKIDEFMAEQTTGEDIDQDRLREVIEEDLLKEKIFDWLLEHTTVELVPEGSLAPAEDDEIAAADEVEAIEPAADATVDVTAEAVEVDSAELEVEEIAPADESVEDAAEKTAKAAKRKAKAAKSSADDVAADS
jgi:trigger factor